jgi:hypothetical protein
MSISRIALPIFTDYSMNTQPLRLINCLGVYVAYSTLLRALTFSFYAQYLTLLAPAEKKFARCHDLIGWN